jgi:hypothetical protein
MKSSVLADAVEKRAAPTNGFSVSRAGVFMQSIRLSDLPRSMRVSPRSRSDAAKRQCGLDPSDSSFLRDRLDDSLDSSVRMFPTGSNFNPLYTKRNHTKEPGVYFTCKVLVLSLVRLDVKFSSCRMSIL